MDIFTAPHIDALLYHFNTGLANPNEPSECLCEAIAKVSEIMRSLAPAEQNSGIKTIWITAPRGEPEDFACFEEMLEYGEVENREEYEQLWKEEYPDDIYWYELGISEYYAHDGSPLSKSLWIGDKIVICMNWTSNMSRAPHAKENAAVELCALLAGAVQKSMDMLKSGGYNKFVEDNIPFKFRTGLIPRSVIYKKYPQWEGSDREHVTGRTIEKCRNLLKKNRPESVGRIQAMTANDFFSACAAGYAACGYDTFGMTSVEQYIRFADERDDGLTGRGYGPNKGQGIDFSSPSEWDNWFFNRPRHDGHPWEVCRGGNSTHISLYVVNDRDCADTEDGMHSQKSGYYFVVSGLHRPGEAVNFYVAISELGYPVILSDADEIMSRFDRKGYIGIVPHSCPTRYCGHMFPESYGKIVDFIHVYEEDMEHLRNEIIWLPMKKSFLLNDIP